jgi:hypothetical protein
VPALDDGAAVAAVLGERGDAGLMQGVAVVVERPGEQPSRSGLADAFFSVRTMASWPIRSSKVRGRYLRAMTV